MVEVGSAKFTFDVAAVVLSKIMNRVDELKHKANPQPANSSSVQDARFESLDEVEKSFARTMIEHQKIFTDLKGLLVAKEKDDSSLIKQRDEMAAHIRNWLTSLTCLKQLVIDQDFPSYNLFQLKDAIQNQFDELNSNHQSYTEYMADKVHQNEILMAKTKESFETAQTEKNEVTEQLAALSREYEMEIQEIDKHSKSLGDENLQFRKTLANQRSGLEAMLSSIFRIKKDILDLNQEPLDLENLRDFLLSKEKSFNAMKQTYAHLSDRVAAISDFARNAEEGFKQQQRVMEENMTIWQDRLERAGVDHETRIEELLVENEQILVQMGKSHASRIQELQTSHTSQMERIQAEVSNLTSRLQEKDEQISLLEKEKFEETERMRVMIDAKEAEIEKLKRDLVEVQVARPELTLAPPVAIPALRKTEMISALESAPPSSPASKRSRSGSVAESYKATRHQGLNSSPMVQVSHQSF